MTFRARLRRIGLAERLFAVLALAIAVDFAANSYLFDRASSFELDRAEARKIAETVELARRTLDTAPPSERSAQADRLSLPELGLEWTGDSPQPVGAVSLATLRAQVVEVAPELGRAGIELHLEGLPGRGNIGGTVRLSDRSVLAFHTHEPSVIGLNSGRLLGLALPPLVLLLAAFAVLRAMLRPLRDLAAASSHFGTGKVCKVPEQGTDEMRRLIRALNEMQDRIEQSYADRSQTMLAVGHDLKTPLARMALRIDDPAIPPDAREGFAHDIEEMGQLLESLQAYVESDGRAAPPPERTDLAVMIETLADIAADHGDDVSYTGPAHLVASVRTVGIRRAVSNLISNAVHYGGNARVSLQETDTAIVIAVEDDGPGIPADRTAEALQPFTRLDSARVRDTSGMGLGLAIASKAVAAEGGTLTLANRPEGGLRASIELPLGPA